MQTLFEVLSPTFACPQTFRFLSVVTHKDRSVFSSSWKWIDPSPKHFWDLSNHLQPLRDLWQGATVRDEQCQCLQVKYITKFLYNKTNRRTNFEIYSGKKLHVSGSSPAHHQELYTLHSALAHVLQVWRQLACRIRMELVKSWSCTQAVVKLAKQVPVPNI
jgi:hypothetical protein